MNSLSPHFREWMAPASRSAVVMTNSHEPALPRISELPYGRGAEVKGRAITPQMILATLYHAMGIDPATTIPDHSGRPMYLLDDREKIDELL